MPRTPFAVMFAMTSFLALPVPHAFAQQTPDAASDATTPMDKRVGNEQPATDNTLSNYEVRQLKGQVKGVPTARATDDETAPTSVSGTTPVYKEKTGSAAKTEGGDPVQ